MKLLHISLRTAPSWCEPSTFISSSTHSYQVFFPLPAHLTPATTTFLQTDTQSSPLLRSTYPNHLNLPRLVWVLYRNTFFIVSLKIKNNVYGQYIYIYMRDNYMGIFWLIDIQQFIVLHFPRKLSRKKSTLARAWDWYGADVFQSSKLIKRTPACTGSYYA